jgi:hypothetical protein
LAAPAARWRFAKDAGLGVKANRIFGARSQNPEGATHRSKRQPKQTGRLVSAGDVTSISCAQVIALTGDFLSDGLNRSERIAFEIHQHSCRDCSAFLRTYRKTIELTRSFLRQPRLPAAIQLPH